MNYKITIYLFTLFLSSFVSLSHANSSNDEFFKSLFNNMSIKELSYFETIQSYDQGYKALPSENDITIEKLKTLIFQHTRSHETERGMFRTKFLGAKDVIIKLLRLMKIYEIGSINKNMFQNKIDDFLTNKRIYNYAGSSYTICFQKASGSNTPDYCKPVMISSKAQAEIRGLFSIDEDFFSSIELEYMELNALRIATKILEDETFLKDDIGGWSGNFIRSMRGGSALTRCGNETWTYVFFIESLIKQGLIKHLYLRPSYRDIIRSGYFFKRQKHQAVLIHGLYSKDQFVLDSWFENGGEMAHILRKKDWRSLELFENFEDIVPGRKSYSPK